MAIQTTYTAARESLADLLRQVEEDREVVIINRRGHEDVALISAAELGSILETAHLLRSPANARRLLNALQRTLAGNTAPSSVEKLRRDLGLEQAE
jgi:antitoxin YefM